MMIAELTQYEKKLLEDWVVSQEYQIMGKKTTVCLLTAKNGFEIVGTSACVDPKNFNEEIGRFYALKDALDKLDEVVGFYRQCQMD